MLTLLSLRKVVLAIFSPNYHRTSVLFNFCDPAIHPIVQGKFMLSGYFVELLDFSLVGARPCGRITVKKQYPRLS